MSPHFPLLLVDVCSQIVLIVLVLAYHTPQQFQHAETVVRYGQGVCQWEYDTELPPVVGVGIGNGRICRVFVVAIKVLELVVGYAVVNIHNETVNLLHLVFLVWVPDGQWNILVKLTYHRLPLLVLIEHFFPFWVFLDTGDEGWVFQYL